MLRHVSISRSSSGLVCRTYGPLRSYHDESFGFRKPRTFTHADYSERQLRNHVENAPLLQYVEAFRTFGHAAAKIDPLELLRRERVPALDPARYDLTDPSKEYNVNGIIWTKPVGSNEEQDEWWTLSKITQHLHATYVGGLAYEFNHSSSHTEALWFAHYLESRKRGGDRCELPPERKKRIHDLISRSESFDHFMQAKFPNLKRYGLEGGESLLPALDTLFSVAAQAGIRNIVLGSAHRGRLNVLTELLGYSHTALFHKIKGNCEFPADLGVSGDAVSHLVASPHLSYEGSPGPIKVSFLPNPSHLEAVNPVALGKTRAKQYSLLKTSPDDCKLGDKVMCVQLHGDASFAGQGIVMEGLGLSNLPHYTTGGTVHIVVNIGYTTPAAGARSSLYSSDVGKMINAPVLHVNGDHPEDVAQAIEAAFAYRNYFRKDVIVDLIVYRRWGHNELDEPAFTQPLMYSKIRSRRSVPELYEDRLVADNIMTAGEIVEVRKAHRALLEEKLAAVSSFEPTVPTPNSQWRAMVWPTSGKAKKKPDTGVSEEILRDVGKASVTISSDGFEIHHRLKRHVNARLEKVEAGKGLDWATAEAMAFGSLMLEGYDVRISGQDVGRGTFSQRHAMFVNQQDESVIIPLNAELKCDAKLELANSSLSEFAVMGFEYGISWERPTILPIWEAQFGDFFNGAQVVIDTFISSAETKWLRQSGIVLLLPHGLDGAGPEHSSSRLERMLQLSNDRYSPDQKEPNINMHITFPTTPAQYFHLLRRQMKRNYRKPLIVASPKGLLRLPAATSSLGEMAPNTRFKPVLDDPISDTSKVDRVVLLTGKLYYDLVKERQTRKLSDRVALVRLEELSPFPFDELQATLKRYTKAREIVWVQEEPRNQGAFTHVGPRVNNLLAQKLKTKVRIGYGGREEDAVPATGAGVVYKAQQERVLKSAFEGV
ncbi:2-oxoglutarate dehydrogenase, E1 component [Thelephora ganbajun]|uniref:2-oxoglutarate dehydrogenase, E1 component n=1 Tax=Thelephora ganbajun TaxID=370292 RepID=A0ACB6ZT05_THEGA|nr:2-oxoglutarate dehydrogenase, E1 component [Thelephora ganbajun]